MGFSGIIDAKLDVKGRVFLPSDFRKKLAKPDAELVMKRDAYQPCLVIYQQTAWQAEVEALRERLNRWDAGQAMLFRQFLAAAETFTLDTNGRFLVPRRLLQACGIERNVSFIGVDDRIEMWSAGRVAETFMDNGAYAKALEEAMTKPL